MCQSVMCRCADRWLAVAFALLVSLSALAEGALANAGKWLEKNGEAIYGTRIIAPFSTPTVDYTQSKDGETFYAIVKEPAVEIAIECALPENVAAVSIATGRPLRPVGAQRKDYTGPTRTTIR